VPEDMQEPEDMEVIDDGEDSSEEWELERISLTVSCCHCTYALVHWKACRDEVYEAELIHASLARNAPHLIASSRKCDWEDVSPLQKQELSRVQGYDEMAETFDRIFQPHKEDNSGSEMLVSLLLKLLSFLFLCVAGLLFYILYIFIWSCILFYLFYFILLILI